MDKKLETQVDGQQQVEELEENLREKVRTNIKGGGAAIWVWGDMNGDGDPWFYA